MVCGDHDGNPYPLIHEPDRRDLFLLTQSALITLANYGWFPRNRLVSA